MFDFWISKTFVFKFLKSILKSRFYPSKLLLSSVTIKSLSLKHFASLLKLCKTDYQPHRLHDKTISDTTVRLTTALKKIVRELRT